MTLGSIILDKPIQHTVSQQMTYTCCLIKSDLLRAIDISTILYKNVQKQPFRGVLSKRSSANLQQIYRSTAMPKCDFNKFAKQLY